jgi:peroxiredoxin
MTVPACTPRWEPGLTPGTAAIDFTLNDINGNRVALSQFRGKAVVVNFWSTSCPPCRAEMPEFEAVYQQYKDRVVFLGVASSDTTASVRAFVTDLKLSWTFLMDSNGDAAVAYEVMVYPTTYFVDKEGLITARYLARALNRQAIEAEVQSALRGVR